MQDVANLRATDEGLTESLWKAHYRPGESEFCFDCGHVEVVKIEKLTRCLLHDSFVDPVKVCDYHVAATCNYCLWGQGVKYRGRPENDDFSCHNDYVPYDERIKMTPDSPACREYMPVQMGFRERRDVIKTPIPQPPRRDIPAWAQKDAEFEVGLTDAEWRADRDQGRKEDAKLRTRERYERGSNGRVRDL